MDTIVKRRKREKNELQGSNQKHACRIKNREIEKTVKSSLKARYARKWRNEYWTTVRNIFIGPKSKLRQIFAGLMLAVTLIGAGFAVTRNNLASRVSQRMGSDLRAGLFKKIMSFSEDSGDKIDGGSLITRMTNDTSQIIQFVSGIMRVFLKAPITCLGSIVLASLLNIRLSLIIYGVVAVVTGLIYISMKFSYPRFYQLQKAMDRVNLKIQEYLIGVRLVKAFGTYGKETEKFAEANRDLMQRGISSQMLIAVISPFLTYQKV